MNAQHRFLPVPQRTAVWGADDRSTAEETLPIAAQWVHAAPEGPGAGGPSASREEEIRDESGLGSGAGVTAADAAGTGAEENDGSVDILEGGTDAGGTDFGANMGGPGDTGGIRIEGVTPPGNGAAGSNAASGEGENQDAG